GPASLNLNGNAGRVTAIAVDPLDPSGNTVFIGAASGGVWKTTNFLTTDAAGPTWQALTDFGPNFGLNVGSIALFPRKNAQGVFDPKLTEIFVATGEGPAAARPVQEGIARESRQGVGFLRSLDGGQSWTLLDSTDNTKPFATRDHAFLGTSIYKIVVDPT